MKLKKNLLYSSTLIQLPVQGFKIIVRHRYLGLGSKLDEDDTQIIRGMAQALYDQFLSEEVSHLDENDICNTLSVRKMNSV